MNHIHGLPLVLLNSKMADEVEQSEVEAFVRAHMAQLVTSEIPSIYWSALCAKLKNEIYDAGQYFSIMQVEDSKKYCVIVTNDDGIKASDPNSIFLIDHAWTYERQYAKNHLDNVSGLAERMATLMGIEAEEGKELSVEQRRDEILSKMWCFNQTYRTGMMAYSDGKTVDATNPEDKNSLWYIMDEFGSKIQHSDEPTCIMALFYYIPTNVSFTVMWPAMDLEYGDELTRDYQPQVEDPYLRMFRLFPWQPCDVDEEIAKHSKEIEQNDKEKKQEDYGELLPKGTPLPTRTPSNGIYKVYTNCPQVKEFLTDSRFQQVEDQDEADIIWSLDHWKDFRSLEEAGQFINQIPSENLLTCKDLLALTCQRSGIRHKEYENIENDDLLCRGPYWLPVTFNINTELPLFIQHYQRREKRGLDNHWIIKPWNMGRGLDITVTRDLNHIIRMAETGPKVACKYIDKQVLFHRDDVGPVKFDLRYHLFVSSIDPLEVYVDRLFWTRFANKVFALDNLEDYEKHCTVMNYQGTSLKQIFHKDFIQMFNEQYPNHKYEDVEKHLFEVFKQVVYAAIKEKPPKGLGHYSKSRAYYGIDVMLKWADDGSERIIPQIIEFNFLPDCTRACRYFPQFYNVLFSQMFLGDPNGWEIDKLI